MSTIGDADQVRSAATTILSDAQALDTIGRTSQQALLACDFEAVPKSVELHSAAEARRQECNLTAGALIDLARRLQAHARWIDDTEDEVRQLERRIRSWAAANPAGSNPSGCDAGLIRGFPPSLTLDWRDVADTLRRAGAAF